MSEDSRPIRPKAVPLTRAEPAAPATRPTGNRRHGALLIGAAALLLVGVFVVVPGLVERAPPPSDPAVAPAPSSQADPAAAPDPAAAASPAAEAPLARLQQEQARTAAQAALSRFVEQQLRVESDESALNVHGWGDTALAAAKDRAAAGDAAFVREDFAAAAQAYDAATQELEALIARGTTQLEDSLAAGAAALSARDPEAALSAFRAAAEVAPKDPRVEAGLARAERLPEINALLLAARNDELAGRWSAALEALRKVQALDSDTSGLAESLARVEAGVARETLQSTLSRGFAALEAGRHDDARTAFETALRLEPGNPAAQGGLEQVGREAELNRLDRIRQSADLALAEERWDDAEALFAEALALDPNIQFATTGRQAARIRRESAATLAAIVDDPDRLSSERLYAEAAATLEAARAIVPRGAGLDARIEQVQDILERYARPVPVLLRSDNRTQVTVSSVGVLGTFDEKQLELRPGAYTVVGSRDGCRDVRTRIVVRPDMNPVDIRCSETL
jgi:tetratricopeptide (TPR) repeat protein